MSIRIFTAIAGLMLAAAPAQAVITSITLSGGTAFAAGGSGQIVAQPSTFAPTFNNLNGFNELQNVVIGTNGNSPRGSLFDANGLNATAVSNIVSALPVSSHFIYFTRPLNGQRTATGTITFNQNVIAVQRGSNLWGNARSAQLHDGDADFTTLGGSPSLEGGDTITRLSPKTISFSLSIGADNSDAFRVLTAVPEPATWMMMLTGFGLIGFARRRRNVAAAA